VLELQARVLLAWTGPAAGARAGKNSRCDRADPRDASPRDASLGPHSPTVVVNSIFEVSVGPSSARLTTSGSPSLFLVVSGPQADPEVTSAPARFREAHERKRGEIRAEHFTSTLWQRARLSPATFVHYRGSRSRVDRVGNC
jgi:hypothetical protein